MLPKNHQKKYYKQVSPYICSSFCTSHPVGKGVFLVTAANPFRVPQHLCCSSPFPSHCSSTEALPQCQRLIPLQQWDAGRSAARGEDAEWARGGRRLSSPNPDCIPPWYEAALVPPASCAHPSPSPSSSYPHPHKEQLAGDIFDTSSCLSAHRSFSSLAANSTVLGEGNICQSSSSKVPSY